MARSLFDTATGTGPNNPRQQTNFTTAFIDGSKIYGSDATMASILRGGPANPGAKLRTSNDINGDAENLLPRNAFGPAPNAPNVAGDDRVNDNVPLTALHTLFMREHNRLVDVYAAQHPSWSSEELYQRARKTVGAELQSITFNEFLPALLGSFAPAPTGQYDPSINPAVFNEFAAVFERVGHSMLTPAFQRIQNDGQPASGGPLPLIPPSAGPWTLELDLVEEQVRWFDQPLRTEVVVEPRRVVAVLDSGSADGLADILLTGNPTWNTIPLAFSNGDGTFHGTRGVTSSNPPQAGFNFPGLASEGQLALPTLP